MLLSISNTLTIESHPIVKEAHEAYKTACEIHSKALTQNRAIRQGVASRSVDINGIGIELNNISDPEKKASDEKYQASLKLQQVIKMLEERDLLVKTLYTNSMSKVDMSAYSGKKAYDEALMQANDFVKCKYGVSL